MKKAVGKSCSDFSKPSEPFHSQPFFGHYSREGLSKDEDQDPSAEGQRTIRRPRRATPSPTPAPTRQAEEPGHDRQRPTTAKTYDPGAYETEPQARAQHPGAGTGGTQAPADDG